MKILVLGIGNVLFGDEGIGVHLTNFLDDKYNFSSDKHTVSLLDGGTLAHNLMPIITAYDKVILIDCVNVKDGDIGDVYSFDFNDTPSCITWQGSAHEVEMLQTLQMIDMLGELPPVTIVGVIPYVIGVDTTFSISREVLKACVSMESLIIKHIKELGVKVDVKNERLDLQTLAKTSYSRGR
ncbi:MAG: HyaD/HybD family hydrogenase maturation endopeptidase [Sulfurimonas sp.]|nr:HyaD/HybD family hydrogenase maturation endopeptidase [Sulfurimonas sp.]